MLKRRLPLHGLFAVLLALMVQLGMGASVPTGGDLASVSGATSLCHDSDDGGTVPGPSNPDHRPDCTVCPICVAVHAPLAMQPPKAAIIRPKALAVVLRPELPPHSTAPPSSDRPPSQPRAPPLYT